MSGTTENRAQPDLRDFGHEQHVRYASEGPYIFTCTYLVGSGVRRQNSKFRFIRVCIASSGTMCSSWICYLFYCFFFQIEDLSWKFHSRQESLSHVFILKWKFILWVFNEICTDYPCHVSSCHELRAKDPSFLETVAMQNCTDVVGMLFFFMIIAFTLSWLLRLLISWRLPPPRPVESNSPIPYLLGRFVALSPKSHSWLIKRWLHLIEAVITESAGPETALISTALVPCIRWLANLDGQFDKWWSAPNYKPVMSSFRYRIPRAVEIVGAFGWPYSGIRIRTFTSKNNTYENFDATRIQRRISASFTV